MGPIRSQTSRKGYKVNGFDFRTKTFNDGKNTTNYGVCVKGDAYEVVGQDYYGVLDDIIEFSYKDAYGGCITMFKCTWFDSDKGIRIDHHGIVEIDIGRRTYEDYPFILPNQSKQVYYTRGTQRKRDRPPTDWQFVIPIPASLRFRVADIEPYQEDILHATPITNSDVNEQITL